MPNINAKNARIKHDYLTFLKESDGKAESTIDAVCKAISRYEEYAGNADFSAFTKEKAVAVKRRLTETNAQRSGNPISPAADKKKISDEDEAEFMTCGMTQEGTKLLQDMLNEKAFSYRSRFRYCKA